MFLRVNENWLACATVAGIVPLQSNLSRPALALEAKLPGDLSSLVAHALLLRFELSFCRLQWGGCVKVSRCCGCMRNTLAFCSCES